MSSPGVIAGPGRASLDDTRRLLAKMLSVADPVGDRIAADIAAQGDARSIARLLMSLVRFDPHKLDEAARGNPELRRALEMFDDETERPPPWHDRDRLHRGHAVFEDNVVMGFMILGCRSLLECYCWAPEARVLGITQELTTHVARRIPETAQFVLDVLACNGLIGEDRPGLRPGDASRGDHASVPPGIRAIQKVRLMHALMRWLILADPDSVGRLLSGDQAATLWHRMAVHDWPAEKYGLPISQTFLAGTLLTFSHVIVDGLKKMGAPVSSEDAGDFLFVWRVIGRHLGVVPELLEYFDTPERTRVLHQAMMELHRSRTDAGVQLATALEGYMVRNIVDRVPLHRAIGGAQIPRVVMWHLAGAETCRAVGMVPGWWPRTYGFVIWQILRVLGFLSRVPVLRRLSEMVFLYLGSAMWNWRRDDAPAAPADPSTPRPATGPAFPASLADAIGLRPRR